MQSASEHPKIDFTTFILSIGSAAYIGLGVVPSEPGRSPQLDLELARHNIDLLELMSAKTRGNLSAEEAKLLEQILFETRMRFVEIQSQGKTTS